jgi:putative membrane protein
MSLPGDAGEQGTTPWRHLHPAMLWFEAGRILRRLVVPLLVGGFAVSRRDGGFQAFIIVSILISAFGFVSSYLSFRYRLTGEGIDLREGIFTRRRRHIALTHISHVNTHQNALARLIGVVRLDVATEGGNEREASFAALSLAAAEEIRRHVGNVGSVQDHERTLYSASLRDRVLAGATTLRLGGVLAMVFVAWRYIRRLGGGEDAEPGATPEFVGAVMTFVDELLVTISASPALIALSGAALLLGIWGLSMVGAMLRWHGFRIVERGDELHQHSGVLSRSRTVIARERIQAVEVHSSLVRNLLGFAQIAVVVAGSGERARSRIFIPLTAVGAVGGYLKSLWPRTREDLDWQPVHAYYRRQHINRGLLLLVLASLAAFYVVPLNSVTIVTLALIMLGLAWLVWRTATPSWARTGFALSDGYLYVRRGAVSPRSWVVATSRIQAVVLEQSFPQRRHGVVNVVVDVNGLANNQRISIPSVPIAQAERMQMALTPRGDGDGRADLALPS